MSLIRLIAVWLSATLAVTTLSLAGVPLTGAGGTKGGSSAPPPSYTGVGDVVSGAYANWGLRAYTASQADGAHAGIKAQRLSDGHTCDLLITTGGFVLSTSVTANCSAGGENGQAASAWGASDTLLAATFYDLSGNGRDVSHAYDGGQAVLTLGATAATTYATAAGGAYCTTGTHSLPVTVSVSAVYYRATTSGFQTIVSFGGIPAQLGSGSGADKILFYAGNQPNVTLTDNTWHAVQAIFNGASSSVYIDGSSTTGLDPGAIGSTAAAICFNSSANAWVGRYREATVYANAQAASFASSLSGLDGVQRGASGWGF